MRLRPANIRLINRRKSYLDRYPLYLERKTTINTKINTNTNTRINKGIDSSLHIRIPPMLPKLNRKRALFVLTKIDEILAWERRSEAERDTRFVELGRYLCEVRAGQYWRLEKLKSFDEFLARRFPESRRKAYYLMSIHEHLPPQARRELKEVGWTKG